MWSQSTSSSGRVKSAHLSLFSCSSSGVFAIPCSKALLSLYYCTGEMMCLLTVATLSAEASNAFESQTIVLSCMHETKFDSQQLEIHLFSVVVCIAWRSTCRTAQLPTARCYLERVAYLSTNWTQTPTWIWHWMNWDSGSFMPILNMVETWLSPNSIKVIPVYLHKRNKGKLQVGSDWWFLRWPQDLWQWNTPGIRSAKVATPREPSWYVGPCMWSTTRGTEGAPLCSASTTSTTPSTGLLTKSLALYRSDPTSKNCHSVTFLFLLQWRKPRDILPKALHQPQQHPLPPGRQEAVRLGWRLPDRVHGGDPEERSGACGSIKTHSDKEILTHQLCTRE